ncbi:hypothetical protein EGW08_000042, partial [Elysia chlorotica]
MDEPREGRPTSVVTEKNVSTVEGLVKQDRRITVKQLASETRISVENASVTAQTCNHDRWNKDYLYSKEVLFDGSHLFWGPRPPTAPSSYLKHWQAVPNDGRLVMYLRNVAVDDQGPQYNPDRLQALQFSGQQDSYATVPDTTGSGESVRADSYFTWFFEVKPAAGGSGEDVRIGASFDPTLPSFSGSLGCVQFFPGYMLKNYESVPEFCDPALSRDDSLTV